MRAGVFGITRTAESWRSRSVSAARGTPAMMETAILPIRQRPGEVSCHLLERLRLDSEHYEPRAAFAASALDSVTVTP